MVKEEEKKQQPPPPPVLQVNETAKFKVLDVYGVSQKMEDGLKIEEENAAKTTEKKRTDNARLTKSSAGKIDDKTLIARGDFKVEKDPVWLKDRLEKFEAIKAIRDKELESKVPVPIQITLPDGTVKDGEAWKTTPFDIAASISERLASDVVVSRLTYTSYVEDYSPAELGDDGEDVMMGAEQDETKNNSDKSVLWDLSRPLVGNCSMQLLKFDDLADTLDAKMVFWHSSAHILGEALEHELGAKLTIGPPLQGGFYYDCYIGNETFSEANYPKIEAQVQKIVKQKQPFERLVVTKSEALEMFKYNEFKTAIISAKVPDEGRTTVYKCGDLIDLCRGPHLVHTGKVKAFQCAKHSSVNWLGDVSLDKLQRMYGISFPDKKQLKQYNINMEKAKERDHRRIGVQQELFFFSELSPGSAFFLPHGTRIYNGLMNFIKDHYWDKGYTEVITPNVFNLELWHRSGHALHYKDAMFTFEVEKEEWGMKPMNCPAHCVMFRNSVRSYKDLPMRLADFGVLHRNELSGALSGLTRVRRFVQDDAHIFCTQEQIEKEVLDALNFMKEVYDVFGMSYKLELSTRPAKALGEIELWNTAEAALARAMNSFIGEGNWRENPGDGAFYGPKIDIKVMDAMERIHQCATIQLDFQLPIRFDLSYNTSEKGVSARPVIVHRAMLGSVERMFAVLCEHYGGKWPFWLSPRQIMLIPVHQDWFKYCEEVRALLHKHKFYVDVDTSKNTFQKKVRNAQIAQYNFQLVVGAKEVENKSVNVRTRDNKVEGEISLDDLVQKLTQLRAEFN